MSVTGPTGPIGPVDQADPVLVALVDTLLPGGDDWPAAVDVDVPGHLAAAAPTEPALVACLHALGEGFASAAHHERAERFAALEVARPAETRRVVELAYVAYYGARPVRARIAEVAGYEDRPPLPLGHTLPAFDPTVVAVARTRPHRYPTIDPRPVTGR